MKKQLIFTYSTEAEHQQLIAVLEAQGFRNSSDGRDEHCPQVICADEAGMIFYRLNATCCAGLKQGGKVFHSADEAQQVLSAGAVDGKAL